MIFRRLLPWTAVAFGMTGTVSFPAGAPVGTAVTYQGQLKLKGVSLNSTADFVFTLWDDAGSGNPPAGGKQIGDPVVVENLPVVNGLFTVHLDFGAAAFNGEPRWLQIEVRSPHDESGQAPLETLFPRQPLTAAPQALFALDGPGVGATPWQTNGDDVFYDNGNVGIGTMSPAAGLQLSRLGQWSWTQGTGWGDLSLNNGTIGFSIGVATAGGGTGDVRMWTTGGTERLMIGNPTGGETLTIGNGHVGIGTTSPQHMLHLHSLGPTTIHLEADTNNAGEADQPQITMSQDGGIITGGIGFFDSSNSMSIRTFDSGAGTPHLLLEPEGNVGIGTTTPQADLHVRGSSDLGEIIVTPGTTDSAAQIRLTENASASLGALVKYDGTLNQWQVIGWNTDGATDPHLVVGRDNGRVGIGTTSPENTLHVHKGSAGESTGQINAPLVVENSGNAYVNILTPGANESGVLFGNPTSNAAGGVIYNNPSTANGLQFRTNGNVTRMVLDETGRAGIGTSSPQADLHVRGGSPLGELIVTPNTSDSSAQIRLTENTTASLGALMKYDGTLNQWQVLGWNQSGATEPHVVVGRDNGRVGIGTTSPAVQLHVNGTTRTNVLELAGADLAEEFPFSDAVEPGKVVMIDARNPGKLTLARGAYNRRVAGIVAGANRFFSGVVLGRDSGSEHGSPVALSGRVYVWCDTSNGPIEPGDMLTTSEATGYAMKVTDFARAQGAILGKAMTSLTDGPGLVLVLVSLQ